MYSSSPKLDGPEIGGLSPERRDLRLTVGVQTRRSGSVSGRILTEGIRPAPE